ncbi:MAG: Response regulator receiver domain/Protein of unknown function (DUF3685) [Phormidesmis priestleyi Ana]|uniref:Response regulatory domain-containing protein n=1 Tax=Phormidesmis priestleyi Ana TaxID=1666911 RepID=A0A0P7YTQ1_9CYAN|nr:MAG: Response regulator receiver domain/Protein of unknown function (DUF3685) [Phormidesmis priestleyi Ana]
MGDSSPSSGIFTNMSDVTPPSLPPLQLMLVDHDPVFRLGLKVWLEQQGDFTVAIEAETAAEALDKVRKRFQTYQPSLTDAATRKKKQPIQPVPPPLDLIILDLGLGAAEPDVTPGLQLCQQLKTSFPKLPVLVLSKQAEPALQAAAARVGADGYGTRSMPVRRLAQLIRQVAVGQPAAVLSETAAETETDTAVRSPTPPPQQTTGSEDGSIGRPTDRPEATKSQQALSNSNVEPPTNRPSPNNNRSALSPANIPGPLTAMRLSMRLSGLQQIDQALADLDRQRTTSWLGRMIAEGKKRELTAARWLVSSVWRTPQFADSPRRGRAANRSDSASPSLEWFLATQQAGYGQNYADMTAARYLDRDSLIPNAAAAIAASQNALNRANTEARLQRRPTDVQTVVFEGVFAKLQYPLKNISTSPLEIDILRPDKKLELLYLVLRQLEDLISDLRASQVQPGQLPMRALQVVQDLWDEANTEFFGKYYTVRIGNVEEEVVTLLKREKPVIQDQVLDRIPMVPALFGHWLFQDPMVIENVPYSATTPQAIAYSESLLENLIIQVANAVMQPLLNRLADVESIKKGLYAGRLMSSREIERFRNDLSWRYRLDRLVNEPKAIFESRYNLYVLTPVGIKQTSVYAPRRSELDRLGGIPLVVTLAMETRDAIAPRLRTAFSLVGTSVVYVLTEVVGRGIGLVGRGILKGVGSAWQDTKSKRPSKQRPVYPQPPKNSAYNPNTSVENPYNQDFNEWE